MEMLIGFGIVAALAAAAVWKGADSRGADLDHAHPWWPGPRDGR
jgi:hypothetical protein